MYKLKIFLFLFLLNIIAFHVSCQDREFDTPKFKTHKISKPTKNDGLQYRFPDTVEYEINKYFNDNYCKKNCRSHIEMCFKKTDILLILECNKCYELDSNDILDKVLLYTNRYYLFNNKKIPIFFQLDRMYSITLPVTTNEEAGVIRYKWADQYDKTTIIKE